MEVCAPWSVKYSWRPEEGTVSIVVGFWDSNLGLLEDSALKHWDVMTTSPSFITDSN